MTIHRIALVVLCTLGIPALVMAQRDDKRAELADQISQLQSEIEDYKQQMNTLSQERVTLESTLGSQRLEARRLATELKLVNSKIAATEKNIARNRAQNSSTELSVREQRSLVSSAINTLAQVEQQSIMELWLSGGTIEDLMEHAGAVEQVSRSVSSRVARLNNLLDVLDTQHTTLQTEKARLQKLQIEARQKKQLYDAQVAETAALVARTKNQESIFQQEIAAKEALRKSYEQELFAYESQLSFDFDKTKIPAPGTQPLSWPLANPYITQRFGVTSTSGRLYQSGSHSGVDFRGNNDPVYAMAEGVVEGVGDTDRQCPGASFGKWVFIRYANGLASTYGHLALITATEGQRVRRGDLVGYSGNTGRSTAPHLHVSVYVSFNRDGSEAVSVDTKPSISCKGKELRQPMAPTSAYLDPLLYLPRAGQSMFKPGA